jgi:hypothetical protein
MARRFRAVQTVLGYQAGETFEVDTDEELDQLAAYLAGGKVVEEYDDGPAVEPVVREPLEALVGVPAPQEPTDPEEPGDGDPGADAVDPDPPRARSSRKRT